MTSLGSDNNILYDLECEPSAWSNVFCDVEVLTFIQTRKACPLCGIGLGLLLNVDRKSLEREAKNIQRRFNQPVPADGFSEEYSDPVFVYCDNPTCPYHAAGESEPLREVLIEWREGAAPDWAEFVEGVAKARGWL